MRREWKRCVCLVAILLAASAECLATGLSAWEVQVLDDEPNRHLQQLAQYTDGDGSLARTFLSPAHKKAAQQLKDWMADAGLEAWVDFLGNVHGRLNGANPNAPAIFLGSHYDTVLDGGKYDGALGVIVGISAIKALLVRAAGLAGLPDPLVPSPGGELSVRPDLPLELAQWLTTPLHLVAFTDEEGVRFQSTFLGSRAVIGKVSQYGMLAATDKAGLTLQQVLEQEAGFEPGSVEDHVNRLAVPAHLIQEYLEVHIEQGPVLEQEGQPLGVVSAIAGQTRLWMVINGTQGHAGTVPMRGRQDALAAAAAVVALVEQACHGGPAAAIHEEYAQDMLVCTVGELRVWPGASNVIAGQVQLSIDIRAKTDALREAKVAEVVAAATATCAARGVACEIRRTHDAPAVASDLGMLEGLQAAIREAQAARAFGSVGGSCVEAQDGAQTCSNPDLLGAPVLVSGAGHDALAMAEVTKMAMLFVRCRGGVSHSPLEHVLPEDVAAATAALERYLTRRVVRAPPKVMHDGEL